MDKKSKDPLRHYKKSSRHAAHSSSESSSSDSDTGSSSSYSSTDSEHNRISERHRKKKSSRRANSSSGDDRRKRDKRDHLQKKLEAKRNHLKRKLKEAKLKKRAAAAAAALSGHGHRALSPATQAKLKKLAERKHLRAASKEGREREREKLRAVQRDRDRDHHRLGSRSPPTKTTKIRIHQDVKRQKSPGVNSGGASSSSTSRMHHQLMSREKIIIQTRTRDRTPSIERERERGERPRHEHKQRHDELSLRDRDRRDRERERAEREAARDKERAEALARCQERQRERERLARAKMRREEEEKKYGDSTSGSGTTRLRQLSERNLEMTGSFGSRERSLDATERSRHINKREIDPYDREQEYIVEPERHGMIDDIRRYGGGSGHRQRELSPLAEHYPSRIREPRDMYPDEERDHIYKRGYPMEVRYTSRERESWMDSRELRDHEIHDSREFRDSEEVLYTDERDRVLRERERTSTLSRSEWKSDWERSEWDEGGTATPGRAGGFVGGPKRVLSKQQQSSLQQQGHQRADSESNWDTDEQDACLSLKPEPNWLEHEQREKPRTWQSSDWRDADDGFIGGSGSVRGGPDGGHLTHQPSPTSHHPSPTSHHPSPTPHHLHPRSERGGRGFRRGGAHSDHLSERGSQSYRPHPPPLMTLPVQPPGGYHSVSGGGGSSRGFPHKRLTYTNPGYGKKHPPHLLQQRYSPQPGMPVKTSTSSSSTSSSAAQASAVVAATTAVAAAKAAAQSTANATTNPGILGQVSKVTTGGNSGSSNNYANDNEGALTKAGDTHVEVGVGIGIGIEDKQSGELSEISDSDDDILNKTDKVKPKSDELVDGAETLDSPTDALSNDDATTKPESSVGCVTSTCAEKADDDEVLDFEEISDGELEEDARHKGIGDALGVDWQGLIAETRAQASEYATTQETVRGATGKQSWQAHRILLDVGVSLRMAGSYYGQQLINDARAQFLASREEERVKRLIKHESGGQTPKDKYRSTQQSPPPLDDYHFMNSVTAPLACIQAAQRSDAHERQKMVSNVCGPNSRALSARQDLKLRRQLCGLPARECDLPNALPTISSKLQTLAMHIFQQRAMDVK